MKFTFQVRYHTRPGQSLHLIGNHEIFGSGGLERAVALEYVNHDFWSVTIELARHAVPDVDIIYNYVLREADGSHTYDAGRSRRINLASFLVDEVLFVDAWNDASYFENAFYTEPFRRVLLEKLDAPAIALDPAFFTHTFKVKSPLLQKDQALCLLGNNGTLRDWNTKNPVLLNKPSDDDFYSVSVDLSREAFPIEYKYGVFDLETKRFVRYEDGANRVLNDFARPNRLTILHDGFVVWPSTTWKGAGIVIPVFSLRSEKSFGVGEFTDLKPLSDWCHQVGLKLIQILPVNDTTAGHTWRDSYPYAAISAFALNPIYLNLDSVADSRNKPALKKLEPERLRLNELDALDYESVAKIKTEFLKEIFPSQKAATFRSEEYRQFFEENRHWLAPYAAFCYLRDKHGTADFTKWPEHKTYDEAAIVQLSLESPAYDDIVFNYFVQFHLHVQLREATEHARSRGVIVKGDVAIGISRYGVDAWKEPAFYHMDVQAGAPPDDFGIKGQNWGFPTYNWRRMRADGYRWWKQRFGQMDRYFDAFRIDHILGFFRIWSVPLHAVEGILGHFVPAIPAKATEFQKAGVPLDVRRYTQPYITNAVLQEIFGSDADSVKSDYLARVAIGYALKREFATQRQVEAHFVAQPDNPRNRKLKQGLYDLISNVILFEIGGSNGGLFHFRFGIDRISSFKSLEVDVQARLKELYNDYFFRRQDIIWRAEAMEKLPALKRVTDMLICGEDLGLVPTCVPEVMRQLGLLSLEIQRMPKDMGKEFFHPKDAPYLSVVTPSTHDMSTIRGWWTEDPQRTQKFFKEELGQKGLAPSACEAWISQAVVMQHLKSSAMWSIFQIQDLLGMDDMLRRKNPADERINDPIDPQNYWRYRMHLTIEALQKSQGFNAALKEKIRESGR